MKASPIDLRSRIALRPREAAEALGVSERTLRNMLPELPHIRRGGVLLFPARALERWIEAEAAQESRRSQSLADEIARSFETDFE